MKKILLLLAVLSATCMYSQDYKKTGKIYEAVKKTTASSELKTEFTWKDTKGIEYPIYVNKNTGSCYIKKVSKKTLKEYKQYLGEELSKDICKELNIKYTPKN